MTTEKKKKAGFTVDEKSRSFLIPMPSITRLLNRKKLALSSTKTTTAAPSDTRTNTSASNRAASPSPSPPSLKKPAPVKPAALAEEPQKRAPAPAPKKVEREISPEEDRATRTEIVFAPPELQDDPASPGEKTDQSELLSSNETFFQAPDPLPVEQPQEENNLSLAPQLEQGMMQGNEGISLTSSSDQGLVLDLPENGFSNSIFEVPPPSDFSPESLSLTDSLGQNLSFSSNHLTMQPTPLPDSSPPNAPVPKALLKARPAKIRASNTCQLHVWDYNILKSNSDPLARGILTLIEKGATGALFLTLVSPPPGAPAPHFLGSAMAGEKSKQNIWTGLKWDPVIVPSVWNYFVRSGYVELSPPGTRTDQMSQRNVMRGAFGILPDEWLLLVRVGPENACRGALALVSKKSMVEHLSQAMNFLIKQAPKAA